MTASVQLLSQIGFRPAQASHLGYTLQIGITASGANQANAYQLTQSVNQVLAGANNSGVRLPKASLSDAGVYVVKNITNPAVQILLYPYTGDYLQGLINTPVAIANGAVATVYKDVTNGVAHWVYM